MTLQRRYAYVGPPELLDASRASKSGTIIRTPKDLSAWLWANSSDFAPDGSLTATFVVDCEGVLRLTPRRSEHVACASGGPVLSAGEITFSQSCEVIEITNQSTGFCPEPESWPIVAAAIDSIPLRRPDDFTSLVIFRLCSQCDSRNIVKDDWYVCDLCGADLPADWNFPLA